ncbi:MAG: hypothetical protein NTY02_05895 [Acidobacteria bacterium]|nr:hypothetical protein [Acidobacteriota bacterium]
MQHTGSSNRRALALVSAVVALLVVMSAATASAQPSLSANIGGSLDSFHEGQSGSEQRQNLNESVGFEHLFASARGRVFYNLDGGTFDSPGDWSYLLQTAGFTYRFGGQDASDRHLYVNGSFVGRLNGDAWANADYRALGASVNAEFHPGTSVTLRSGYRTDYRVFSDLSELTQFEHRAFASVLANLETRTTIIGEVQVGAKSYAGQVVTDVITIETPVTTGSTTRGHGISTGPSLRPATTTSVTPVMQSQNGNAGLVAGLVRVAQSLADRTGAHAQAAIRRTFGAVPPGVVTTPVGFLDDGVYDDPFASDAVSGQAGLTQAFAGGAEISAQASWADKRYTSTPALDTSGTVLPGSPLRHDTVWRGGILWRQPVMAAHTGKTGLSVEIGYRFTHSRSNDAYYDYTSHGMGFGFSIDY